MLSADSHLRFLSAFLRVVNRGNMCLDLDAFAQLGRICYFQGLQNLSLRSNQLTKLPSEIGNLQILRVLKLAYNRLDPPLVATFFVPNMMMTADNRQFQWFLQSRGVFYFALPARTLVPVNNKLTSPLPSLLETCIWKMCIIKDLKGKEESLIGDNDGLQHPLLQAAPDPAALLPVQLQKILADPGAYFYCYDLCISRLALKPGALPQTRPHPRHAFQFIDQHAGLVPLNE
ncbi:hypothetical protein PtA15_17A123 [Puccinia triticina]|uniref:Uncharacterized protein n=1 Tax=Puccinia triticina TaxID=208348 RepID=A0ABY7D5J0_9BASI|nr:uncharacterized protein PtA15_17A123 [Puccinia triticina]WAQ92641.1 hypothetical protein PtA15_17A123 [Puccinia triticina]